VAAPPSPPGGAAPRLLGRLFAPVDIAWLVYFRIAFGVLMAVEAARYLLLGHVYRYYVEPEYLFTYPGFDWVRPWPGPGMYLHVAALGILSAAMAAGFFYRAASALFFLGFTYIFLLDKARYLNHFYLIVLLSFLMACLPAHRAASIDAVRNPAIRWATVPAWTLWLLRAQLGLVYFYAGLAKLNGDWLRAEPLRHWLPGRSDYAIIGPLLAEEWLAWFMSYGALVLDLLAFPLLLWRRTRAPVLAITILFHLANRVLFSIGIFPWMMIAATLIFLPPQWPRRVFPPLRRALEEEAAAGAPPHPPARRPRLVAAALGLYLAVQVLVPLRHHLYPGVVDWTEEGHRFSWRMKLRGKDGWIRYLVTDLDTGRSWTVNPDERLTPRQARKMAGVPDMILQYAHHIARREREAGHPRVRVQARARVSLNGRRPQLIVDPEADLAAVPFSLLPARWILPLEEPLPMPEDPAEEGDYAPE
jgi:hypothetical protein